MTDFGTSLSMFQFSNGQEEIKYFRQKAVNLQAMPLFLDVIIVIPNDHFRTNLGRKYPHSLFQVKDIAFFCT